MEKVTENNQSRISSLDKAYEEYRQKCVKNGLGIDNDDEITKKIIKGDITPEQLETIEGKILPEEQFKAYYYKELAEEVKLKDEYFKKNAKEIECEENILSCLQVLSDDEMVLGGYNNIHLFKLKSDGKHERMFIGREGDFLLTMQVLPDGSIYTGGNLDGYIGLWTRQPSGHYRKEVICKHKSFVTTLQVLSDGKIFSGDGDGNIYCWTPQSDGEYKNKLIFKQEIGVESIQVLQDGRIFFAGGERCGRFFSLIPQPNGTYHKTLLGLEGDYIKSLQVLSDDRIIVGGSNGSVSLWTKLPNELYERRGISDLNDGIDSINSVRVFPNGRVVVGLSNKILTWD